MGLINKQGGKVRDHGKENYTGLRNNPNRE